MFVYIHRATSTSLIRVWAPSGSRTQQLETYIVLKGVSAAAAAKSLLSCLTLCDPIDSIPRGSRPWDSPGKNTGVGCHFLLPCMKVKSESEVTQSCPTLCNPMNCSTPGLPVHHHCCCQVASIVSDPVRPHRRQPTRLPRPWDSPGKNTGVGCHCLQL